MLPLNSLYLLRSFLLLSCPCRYQFPQVPMENSINYFYDPQAIESRIIKKKRVTIDENLPIGLKLNIRYAQGIDNPSLHPSVLKRHYCVLYWVKPNEEFVTGIVEGMLDPRWNQKDMILLGNSCDDYGFLHVEVVRRDSANDPGTSRGYKIVGRASIPLPKEFNSENSGRFGLVRMEEGEPKGEGFIVLSMELQRLRVNPNLVFVDFRNSLFSGRDGYQQA